MKTEDIVKWVMPEFPIGERFSGESSSYKKKIAVLQLICAYFQKLFAGDIPLEFPSMDYYQVHECSYYDTEPLATIINNYEEAIKESLFNRLLEWSSFEQVQIDLANTVYIPGIRQYDMRAWDADKRKTFIRKYVECSMNDFQKRLYEAMPGPVLDSLDMQSERKAVYLFCERLAKYLGLAEQQESFVMRCFLQEHEQLVRMLSYFKAPIENNLVCTYMYVKEFYIMGYCIGRKDYNTVISYKSYDWTFFMAWYILEKILQRTDELFL